MARVVFDLDGTLIDSVPDIRALANRVLAPYGVPPLTLDETRSFVGRGVSVLVSRMRDSRGLGPETQDPILSAFLDGYDAAVGLTTLMPGVTEALDALAADGHRLGICTNKPESPARAVLDHLGLAARFGVVIGGDTLPERKPDPAPLRAAFDALGSGPPVFVGDSGVDAETAAAAGVPFLLFTGGYREDDAPLPCAAAFSDFAALPDLIRDNH